LSNVDIKILENELNKNKNIEKLLSDMSEDDKNKFLRNYIIQSFWE
jgi:hypothetical protein